MLLLTEDTKNYRKLEPIYIHFRLKIFMYYNILPIDIPIKNQYYSVI